ncbi:MAG TPA: rod shape-determining protein RodA [Candidatus Eisenbacteria bacterium]
MTTARTRIGGRTFDWQILLIVLALVAFGVAMVYSATHIPSSPGRANLWRSQILWAMLGLTVATIGALVPYRVFETFAHILYAGSVFLLLLVPVIGVSEYGAKRWLDFGGFNFQPSEPAKILTVLMLARYLDRKRLDLTRPAEVMGAVGIMLLPWFLIVRQPDLGTSLSLPVAAAAMLYWAGLPAYILLLTATPLISMITSLWMWIWVPYILALFGAMRLFRAPRLMMVAVLLVNIGLGLATPHIWNHLKPYQRERVHTFLDPNRDRSGSGYQIIQSRIAIGSGGAFGKGYMEGTQKALAFLPMQHTDFIYSVVGEEFGFIGTTGVLLLLGGLIIRGFWVAGRARNRFASLLAVGIATTFLFHTLVNTAMTAGMAPVTGIPLPFISYGGTFMITCLFQAGLLLNVAIRRNEY